jgi:hypothetical protein
MLACGQVAAEPSEPFKGCGIGTITENDGACGEFLIIQSKTIME